MTVRRIWLIVLLLAATSAAAEQALVRNHQNTALEVGQGYLTHYDGICYLLLPVHVIREAGETAALLGEGVPPLLGETDAVKDLGDDVALAAVRGGLSDRCGYSAMSVSRAVARTIRDNGLATIRSVNGDGTVAQVSVSLLDDDGERFLRIQPTLADNQLRKGQSGSLLVVGDKPIGMLLSVDARYGVGKVIRMDAMLAKFDDYVRGRAASTRSDTHSGTATRTTGAQSVPGQPLTLLSWNTLPASEAERPINLLALDDGPGWRARVTAWPVELEFSLGDERMAIRGLRLEAGNAPPAMLPGSVEIFVSSTEGRDRWRSLYGGSLAFEDGVAELLTAPTWARKIRLVISASADDPGQVAFDRLRVLTAD